MSRPASERARSTDGETAERRDPDADLIIDPDAEVALPADDVHWLRDEIDIVLSIGIGGFFGTLGRYAVGDVWTQHAASFPLATFVLNVSGSLAIGVLLTLIFENLPPMRYLRPITCVGLLGGWTTMSSLAVVGDHLVASGHAAVGLAYIVLTTLTIPVAAAAGIAIAHRLPRHSSRIDAEP